MKTLTRSTHDRWLFGVCGGIAEQLGVSSLLVRLVFILGSEVLIWVYAYFLFRLPSNPYL